MYLKAVLFDLDRTLIDRDGSVVRFAKNVWSACDPKALGDQAQFIARFVELDDQGLGNKDAMYHSLVAEFMPGRDPTALAEDFRHRFPGSVQAFTDAIPTLETLRRAGYRTGVITNGRGRGQREKMANAGLLSLLDTVVISEEAGIKKPHPEIFLMALGTLGCRANESIFVGDSEEADVKGAKAMGMSTLLRRYAEYDFPTLADAEIGSLTEVLAYLRINSLTRA